MRRRPPRSTRTDTLFPYTALFRALVVPVRRRHGEEPARLPHDEEVRVAPEHDGVAPHHHPGRVEADLDLGGVDVAPGVARGRSEEHTSELPSLMRTPYAVFRLKKKHQIRDTTH